MRTLPASMPDSGGPSGAVALRDLRTRTPTTRGGRVAGAVAGSLKDASDAVPGCSPQSCRGGSGVGDMTRPAGGQTADTGQVAVSCGEGRSARSRQPPVMDQCQGSEGRFTKPYS